MRKLVILRPEPGAGQTLARARELGLDPVVLPLFVIEPVDWMVPDPAGVDGLLLTSANAVRAAGAGLAKLAGLPAYAVGAATAAAAQAAGLELAATGQAGVDELLRSIPCGGTLLHLCGEHRKAPADNRHQIIPLEVYRSRSVPAPAGLDLLRGAVVMVHSPRAGARLAELVEERGRTAVAAISRAAAEACGHGWEQVATAARPDDHALLSLGHRLCKDSHPL